MKKTAALLASLAVLAVSGSAFAINGTYSAINSYKVWDTHVDIYFEDGQQHDCTGDNKTRFMLDPAEDLKARTLLAAFMGGREVMLAYTCGSDNQPWITGVRVR